MKHKKTAGGQPKWQHSDPIIISRTTGNSDLTDSLTSEEHSQLAKGPKYSLLSEVNENTIIYEHEYLIL